MSAFFSRILSFLSRIMRGLFLSVSDFSTNLYITFAVGLLVFILPLADRRVCNKLHVNINHRMTGSSKESNLLRLRKLILYGIFCAYMAVCIYLVFFSRAASNDYRIHIDPLADVKNALFIDTGLFGILADIYTQGLSGGLSHIHIAKPEDITQIYLNFMLFVPIGYLLPYTFDWVRARVHYRPVLFCFLISFIIENLQLIFRRGFYDMDDLISNTAGGLFGQLLYISFAFVLTHPEWKKEVRSYRKWRKIARKRTLYPFAKRAGSSRTTILSSDEATAWNYYVQSLGFRPIKKIINRDEAQTSFLLQLGKFQLEVICPDEKTIEPGEQHFTIAVENIVKVRKRLQKAGYEIGEFETDPYTGLRCFNINGPDQVEISFIE